MTTPAATIAASVSRLERWSDRLNPLLVREVRQSLRGRIFSGAIVLTALIAAVVLICGILAGAKSGGQEGHGRDLFAALYYLLWGMCCLLMPLGAASRFRNERGSGEFELFLITGISARQVISGKLQSALVQALLVLATAAPFLMTCYLLRGISALEIALNLVALVLVATVLTQCGIMLGVISTSKVVFALLMLPFLWGLATSFTIAAGLLHGEIFTELFSSVPDAAIAGVIIVPLHYFILFHLGAVAILEMPSCNRTFPLRLYLLLVALALPAGLMFCPDEDARGVIFYALLLPAAIAATLLVPIPEQTVFAAVREQWGRGWRRWVRFLFYPDRGSVMAWHALFIIILGATEMLMIEESWHLATLCAVLLLWGILGNMMGRMLLPRVPTILLAVVGNGVPALLSLFLYSAGHEFAAKLLFPLTTASYIMEVDRQEQALPVIIVLWAFFLVYGCLLHWRFRRRDASCVHPGGKGPEDQLP